MVFIFTFVQNFGYFFSKKKKLNLQLINPKHSQVFGQKSEQNRGKKKVTLFCFLQ
jgi:hypothetical protein